MTEPVVMVWCTFPSMEAARTVAATLLEAKLAACVNILPGVESHYIWQGKYECTTEILTIWKTRRANWVAFSRQLTELHPYDTPEIIASEVIAGSPQYLQWVVENSTSV